MYQKRVAGKHTFNGRHDELHEILFNDKNFNNGQNIFSRFVKILHVNECE